MTMSSDIGVKTEKAIGNNLKKKLYESEPTLIFGLCAQSIEVML